MKRIDGADGLHRYIYGEFSSVKEALKRLPEIRAMGYRDSFIMNMKKYE